MMVLAGSAATYGIRDLIKDLGSLVGTLRREIGVDKSEERKDPGKGKRSDAAEGALKGLVEALRYAPKGVIAYSADDHLHQVAGDFLGRLFANGGWRDMGPNSFLPPPTIFRDDLSHLKMAFLLPNVHQIDNAAQAVREVFRKLGFELVSATRDGKYLTEEENRLRVLVLFGEREKWWQFTR